MYTVSHVPRPQTAHRNLRVWVWLAHTRGFFLVQDKLKTEFSNNFTVQLFFSFNPMVCSIMETNSCNKSFTSSERNLLIFVHSGSALLSTIMCLFACLVVVCLRLHRQIAYRLALYQILSTLFYSFTEVLTLLLINFNKENGYYIRACTATAFLIMYSLWVQQLFTLFVTFHLFVYVVLLKNMQKLELGYIFTAILLPLFPATTCTFGNQLSWHQYWCIVLDQRVER